MFQEAGLGAEYDEIGGWHLFMMCDAPNRRFSPGYSFRLCRPDEVGVWANLATTPPYVNFAKAFYDWVYAANSNEFFRRCTFVCDNNSVPVATSGIMRSYGQINTVGWTRIVYRNNAQRRLSNLSAHTAHIR